MFVTHTCKPARVQQRDAQPCKEGWDECRGVLAWPLAGICPLARVPGRRASSKAQGGARPPLPTQAELALGKKARVHSMVSRPVGGRWVAKVM